MTYYHNKINNCSDSRALFKTFSSLLCPPPPPPSSTLTADDFATFFTNKTKTISDQFLTPQTNNNFITTNTQTLTSFSPLSETEVSKLILSNHPTTCPLDPIPTHLLQAISSSVIPALTHIINTSLHTGTFPTAFKQARVSPLLKKPALNSALLENYRDRYPFFHSLQSHLSELCSTNSLCFLHRTTFWTTTNLASEVATQLRLPYFSFQPDDPTVTARIAACLSDISSWMMDHHLQLNLAKTELLVFSANPSLHHNFSIQLGSSTITPSRTARNLGVVIDDQLSFTDHIATTARSCRFALYNIRKIRPFLSEQAAQLLVQALVLSRLDYCNALLAGLPASTIKPLQLIQNAAARVVFNEPKKAHVTPLFIRLHWLPIAARIKFKVLMFAYKTTTGTAPIYLNLLVQTYAPSRSLRSASERRLVVPSQRGTKSLSRTFSWTVPSWWNDLPISIRTAESLAIFKKHLKTHLFCQHLTN